MQELLSWKEVAKFHGTISGISVKNGIVKSILCNDGKKSLYSDKITDNEITYMVGPNTQVSGVKALCRSRDEGNTFTVYRKLGIDKWVGLGKFKVLEYQQKKDNHTAFKLIKQ